jgi:GNAT superfamily N-acetyltransferase
MAECRGRGLELLAAFESWARENNCNRIIMVHLLDSGPEKKNMSRILSRLYARLGFTAVETHYVKEITPCL